MNVKPLMGVGAVLLLMSACSSGKENESGVGEAQKEETLKMEKATRELDGAVEELDQAVDSLNQIDDLLSQ